MPVQIDAAAPAPGSINAGSPSDISAVAFANKYEAIVAAGLPSALYRYAGNDAGPGGSPAEQAQALAFLQGDCSTHLQKILMQQPTSQ